MFYIIIPIYNIGYKYLFNCLNSIFQNRHKLIKNLILINDCSPKWNEEFEAIQKFPQKKILILQNQKNLGLGLSRNEGLKYIKEKLSIKNKYILFVDSDDMLSSNALKKISLFLKIYKRPDIMRFNYVSFDGIKKKIIEYNFFFSPKKGKKYYECPETSWSSCYKCEFLIENYLYFCDSKFPHEDVYFYLVTSSWANSIASIGNVCYIYTINRSDSITSIWRERKEEYNDRIKYLNFISFYLNEAFQKIKNSNDVRIYENAKFFFQKFNWILTSEKINNIEHKDIYDYINTIKNIFAELKIKYFDENHQIFNSENSIEQDIKLKIFQKKIIELLNS